MKIRKISAIAVTAALFAAIWITLFAAAVPKPTDHITGFSTNEHAAVSLNRWEAAWEDPGSFQGNLEDLPKWNWVPVDAPLNPPNRTGSADLWLRTVLPEGAWRDPGLLLRASQTYEIYAGGKRIYRFGTLETSGYPVYLGTPVRIIPLPGDSLGEPVYFRIRSDGADIGIRNHPVVSGRSGLILYMLRQHGGRFVFGSFYLLIGFLSLYPFWKLRQLPFLSFGGFASFFGFYTITRTSLVTFFWDNTVFWMYAELFSLMVAVSCIIAFLAQIFGPGPKRIIELLWQFHLTYAAVLLPLTTVGIIKVTSVLLTYQILTLASIVLVLIHLFLKARKGETEAWYIVIGTLLFSACGAIDIVLSIKFPGNDFPLLTSWGMLGLLLFLVVVLIRRLIKMMARLTNTEKLSLAGRLAAGIAHEIRNPVTVISGYLQLLRKDFPNKKTIDVMLGEVNRIASIMNEFLFLAKPAEPKFGQHQLEDIVKDVLVLFEAETVNRCIRFEFCCGEDLPPIQCDANQIKQVLVNVVKNAIEAMPGGGELSLTASVADEWIAIVCKDTGCGVPEKELPRIGDPFYTTKENGTGLGIMICRSIVENHNGCWKMISSSDAGTSVEICLPVRQDRRFR